MNLYKVILKNYCEFYVVASNWNDAATKVSLKTKDFRENKIVSIEFIAGQHLSGDTQYFFDKLDYFII